MQVRDSTLPSVYFCNIWSGTNFSVVVIFLGANHEYATGFTANAQSSEHQVPFELCCFIRVSSSHFPLRLPSSTHVHPFFLRPAVFKTTTSTNLLYPLFFRFCPPGQHFALLNSFTAATKTTGLGYHHLHLQRMRQHSLQLYPVAGAMFLFCLSCCCSRMLTSGSIMKHNPLTLVHFPEL